MATLWHDISCEMYTSTVVQVWDINEPAPAALGDPVGLITASNAVHTCVNLPSAPSFERPAACTEFLR